MSTPPKEVLKQISDEIDALFKANWVGKMTTERTRGDIESFLRREFISRGAFDAMFEWEDEGRTVNCTPLWPVEGVTVELHNTRIKKGDVEYFDGQRQVWTGKDWVVEDGRDYTRPSAGKRFVAFILRKLGASL